MKSNNYKYFKIFLALLFAYPGIIMIAYFITNNLKYKRLFNVTYFHDIGAWHPLFLPVCYFAINLLILKKHTLWHYFLTFTTSIFLNYLLSLVFWYLMMMKINIFSLERNYYWLLICLLVAIMSLLDFVIDKKKGEK